MTANASSWIALAHLLRPQGRKGELLAELLTDFPERFEERKQVFLAAPGFDGEATQARVADVVAFWLPVGKNEGRIVLQFSGVDSISQAEALAGLEVLVPDDERAPLDDDAVYISELVGCTVYDGTIAVGVIADVQFPATADGSRRLEEAAPLLEVTSPDGNEILIPFAKAFVVGVDTKVKRVDMTLPKGLLEVNQSPSPSEDVKTREGSKR
ncbi:MULTISPECIES: ribosome maturation factor RimM [Acidobacteriaceae]|uniref:ribosome maturation factor RimM n=1 Tax=Acidobacteriaceae TaxID=204434 RepID=UPI00131BCF69|nr:MULTISPECIES: ribosome maturation factor RimM [Acidobacteriaceae]MDW5264416.1 ribosome maturation factor RimM [Edaphobacter sp.]